MTAAAPAALLCRHCGQPNPAGRDDGFCCAGCRVVSRLLREQGLERYYELKPAALAPQFGYFDAGPSFSWLAGAPGLKQGRLELGVEGIQCGACVWVIQQLASRAGAKAGVNTALGRLSLEFDPARFDAPAYFASLSALGYRVGPPGGEAADPTRPLLIRLGVCAAIAMNTMFFTLPFYFGLAEDGSGIKGLLRGLNLALSLLSLVYGGGYFFRRAFHALRMRVAHFDIPVALGIASVFLGSLWAELRGLEASVYFDTLNVFIALMLLGRYLQERALLRGRRGLLKGEAFEAMRATVLGPPIRELPLADLRRGMRLLLQPGALVPAAARLEEGPAEFDLASMTGELRPRLLRAGESVKAGARLVSSRALRAVLEADFEAAALSGLLPPEAAEEDLPLLWRWSVRYYLAFVLLSALGGLGFWLWKDPSQAGKVFVSTLVVTCPCGLGIAVPLARTQATRRLMRLGLSLRRPGVLDRLHGVTQVCLDKTGTLSFASLELENPQALERLAPPALSALMGAAAGSRHPVSRALFAELLARGVAYPEGGGSEELPGKGLRYSDPNGDWFLGRSMESGASARPARAQFSLDGVSLARFDFKERLLEDAPAALSRLRAMGLNLSMLSGDHPWRVQDAAQSLGLGPLEARGGLSPAEKAAAVAAAPSLMLGDGLNDGLALGLAKVGGTPSWERSLVAERTDFSFSSGSLAWLPELFETAARLRRVLWLNLGFAWGYNLLMVSLTLQGLVTPLVCALVMPLSALFVGTLSGRAMARP
jgi:Cu2+-exporting ATPase